MPDEKYETVVEAIIEMPRTVPEIINLISGLEINTEGDLELEVANQENLLLWAGLSEDAADILAKIYSDPRLQNLPTVPLNYLDSGIAPPYKFANLESLSRGYLYQTPHLLPVEFSKNTNHLGNSD